MKGFIRRLTSCKSYYCNLGSEAKWLNSKRWAAGDLLFDYRRQITVTEQSGSDLTDYQILIELDSTNFDFSHANEDGSDIRFYDGSNLYPYWIEKWDSVNQEAKIWIKVPSIPASSSTSFYMYYGNPNVMSASSGEDTFEFFDDFEGTELDTDKWSQENGYWTLNVDMNRDILTHTGDEAPEPKHVIVTTQNFSSDIIIEVLGRRKQPAGNGTTEYNQVIMSYSNLDNFILLRACPDKNSLEVYERSGGGWVLRSSSPIDNVYNEYRWIRVYYDGSAYVAKYYKEDWTFLQSVAWTTSWKGDGPIGLRAYGDIEKTEVVDLIRVRKYTDPEPSVSVGNEETL